MVDYTLTELFDQIRLMKSVEEKVALLRKYDSVHMRFILRGFYDPSLVFATGELPTDYTPSDLAYGLCYSSIKGSMPRLQLFVDGASNINLTRRKQLLYQILEDVHADEADMLIKMFTGKRLTGITEKLVKEAFPDLY